LLEKMMAYDSMQSNYRHVQPLNGRTIDGVGNVRVLFSTVVECVVV